MSLKPLIEGATRAMPRRQFLRGVGVPLAVPLLGAMTPAFSRTANTVHPEPAAMPNGRTARNTVELRSEGSGDDYFFAFVRSDVIHPQRTYRLGNKRDDTWTGTVSTQDDRTPPDNVLWPIEVEYEKPDGMSAGGRHPYLDLATIPEQHGHLKYIACDRFTAGCNLSHAFQDHQKDWDFLESKLREILAAARLSDRASAWDKVAAVARFCVQTRVEKKNYSRWVHPVDFCLHGAYCVGAANALVGFCSVLGIPARTIGYGAHTTAEVLLNGKWRWVENTVDTVAALKVRAPVQAVSFLDLLNDPAGQLTAERLSDRPKAPKPGYAPEELVRKFSEFNCVYDHVRSDWLEFNHEAYTNWIFVGTLPYRYEPPRATSGMGSLREISALYPEQKSIRYKCDRSPKVWLTPFRMPSPGRRPEYLAVDQDHGIRQEFHVPSGRPMKAMKSLLVVAQAEDKFWHNIPRDGGDWYYKVNQHKVYIRDLGGWNFKTNYGGTGRNCLELTLKPEWLLAGGQQGLSRKT